jgi:hypothetical protein
MEKNPVFFYNNSYKKRGVKSQHKKLKTEDGSIQGEAWC